jgi:hypothetical protein
MQLFQEWWLRLCEKNKQPAALPAAPEKTHYDYHILSMNKLSTVMICGCLQCMKVALPATFAARTLATIQMTRSSLITTPANDRNIADYLVKIIPVPFNPHTGNTRI